MSRATIEQALTGLVPTLNGPLPPELLELAVSLLSGSRSIAHSLKSDEEIARPYACAQLACERLKKRLNLPTIVSRPPCPPRIYKKLYKYLESALPAVATREPQTPRKAAASAPASGRTTPKTPLSAKKTPKSTRTDGHTVEGAPEWTMSTIRALLKAFSYPAAGPHIYTGVEIVVPLLARMSAAAAETPSKRPRRAAAAPQASASALSDARILGLIATILFYVFSRMMDQDITPEQYSEWREKALTTLLESPAGKDTSAAEIEVEIDQLMPMAQEEGWLQMEWFLNVAPPADSEQMDGIEMPAAVNGAPKGSSKSFQVGGSDYIGLGTMMQDATDYLGVRQRADYLRWKAGIMARVEEIESS
ncbi:hypothetical protein K458DRAFT_393312 [Lentithecium fluviatile CBS 122367]|uniref:ORC6 first cyclin-like domain-containing protein n=1 Tax=Lentithecium fluviatile CBS 122367 TaxID=1168545 RepID=A0A6G1IQ21_9PLEO|nr:hypothetical protein K458DRAFT_393312 [Lentithecium fluviatile CBS 122367]